MYWSGAPEWEFLDTLEFLDILELEHPDILGILVRPVLLDIQGLMGLLPILVILVILGRMGLKLETQDIQAILECLAILDLEYLAILDLEYLAILVILESLVILVKKESPDILDFPGSHRRAIRAIQVIPVTQPRQAILVTQPRQAILVTQPHQVILVIQLFLGIPVIPGGAILVILVIPGRTGPLHHPVILGIPLPLGILGIPLPLGILGIPLPLGILGILLPLGILGILLFLGIPGILLHPAILAALGTLLRPVILDIQGPVIPVILAIPE